MGHGVVQGCLTLCRTMCAHLTPSRRREGQSLLFLFPFPAAPKVGKQF